MKKLTTEQLNRISVDQYKQSDKVPLVVVLDNVRSQNNIGSVFRTSDAFRIESICLCGICSTPPHREIHKTALGAEMSVDWKYFDNTVDCVSELKSAGYNIYAIEQIDNSIKLNDNLVDLLKKPMAIVFGNEVEGVSDEVVACCDGALEIPQYGTKHSLNVSCAAAIVMWEMSRLLRQ